MLSQTQSYFSERYSPANLGATQRVCSDSRVREAAAGTLSAH